MTIILVGESLLILLPFVLHRRGGASEELLVRCSKVLVTQICGNKFGGVISVSLPYLEEFLVFILTWPFSHLLERWNGIEVVRVSLMLQCPILMPLSDHVRFQIMMMIMPRLLHFKGSLFGAL